jgi:hypothetical protein
MSVVKQRRSPDEVARIGMEVYDRLIRPKLRPEDNDKLIAIDIDTGEYELGEHDRSAIDRLRARFPSADIYLGRVGHRATHRMRAVRW